MGKYLLRGLTAHLHRNLQNETETEAKAEVYGLSLIG